MSQFEHSSKLQDIKNCDFSTYQTYFNDKSIENARTKFKIRSKMLEKIPGNFRNKYKNIQNCLQYIFVMMKCPKVTVLCALEEKNREEI